MWRTLATVAHNYLFLLKFMDVQASGNIFVCVVLRVRQAVWTPSTKVIVVTLLDSIPKLKRFFAATLVSF